MFLAEMRGLVLISVVPATISPTRCCFSVRAALSNPHNCSDKVKSMILNNQRNKYWLNLGLGKFYGPNRMAILHFCLLTMSFGIPLLFMCFCLLQKKWQFRNINLACFKLSLLVFYQFIDVPYGYLFYTASFVSLIIASSLLSVEVW